MRKIIKMTVVTINECHHYKQTDKHYILKVNFIQILNCNIISVDSDYRSDILHLSDIGGKTWDSTSAIHTLQKSL